MSKNTSLEALRTHLFEALEGVKNLHDPDASENEKTTIESAKTIVEIADSIIDTYKVQVEAVKVLSNTPICNTPTALMTDLSIEPSAKMIGQ